MSRRARFCGKRFFELRVPRFCPGLLLSGEKVEADAPCYVGFRDLGNAAPVAVAAEVVERNRSNITRQILHPAIERANVELVKAGKAPIGGATNHSLRRTFCALLYEAGATPAYVMGQMGHAEASLALEVYSKVMERKRDTGERMDALLRGADWESLEVPEEAEIAKTA